MDASELDEESEVAWLAMRGHKVEVRANRIPKITTRRIYTDLAADELEHLPPIK